MRGSSSNRNREISGELFHPPGMGLTRRSRLKANIRPCLLDETAGFDHRREDTFHLPFSTSGEEPDEVTFAIDTNLFLGERLQQGMSCKDRVKSACFVHRFLERKHANHQIKQARLGRDSARAGELARAKHALRQELDSVAGETS